jgi:hypothetical protein
VDGGLARRQAQLAKELAMRTILTATAMALLCGLSLSTASAQFNNSGFPTNGSTSGFGQPTGGMSGVGVSAGQRSFSGSGQNSQIGTGTSQQQQAGTLTGSERFIRGNRQGAFVGADSGDSTNSYSQTGANGQGMNGQMGLNGRSMTGRGGLNSLNGQNRLGNQLNQMNQMNGQNGFGAGANAKQQIRTTLVVGFSAPKPVSSVLGKRLETHLTATRGIERLGPIQVSVIGREVVLQGTVRSEHDRDLAEQLALLEPGVGAVRNELQVLPSSPADTE